MKDKVGVTVGTALSGINVGTIVGLEVIIWVGMVDGGTMVPPGLDGLVVGIVGLKDVGKSFEGFEVFDGFKVGYVEGLRVGLKEGIRDGFFDTVDALANKVHPAVKATIDLSLQPIFMPNGSQ